MRRFRLFPTWIFFLTALSWWSLRAEIATSRESGFRCPAKGSSSSQAREQSSLTLELCQQRRRDLIEWLDRLVAHEGYFHQTQGYFSRIVGRVGLSVPPELQDFYEIRITEAAGDHLRVVALSESGSQNEDRATIDDQFNLRVNFPMPIPRAEYLRYVAWKTLRQIRAEGHVSEFLEKTALRGYFRYELRKDTRNRTFAVALGIREPVSGKRMELGPDGLVGEDELAVLTAALGERGSSFQIVPGPDQRELELLGRRIFEGELGRFPRGEQELAIFVPVKSQGVPGGAPNSEDRTDQPFVEALVTPLEVESRNPASAQASVSDLPGNNQPRGLEIEAVPEDN